jgi:hypothetical protein
VIASSSHTGSLLVVPDDIHYVVIQTVPHLVKLLEDEDSKIRAKATSALAQFAMHGA